jgi:hypothetical protein
MKIAKWVYYICALLIVVGTFLFYQSILAYIISALVFAFYFKTGGAISGK